MKLRRPAHILVLALWLPACPDTSPLPSPDAAMDSPSSDQPLTPPTDNPRADQPSPDTVVTDNPATDRTVIDAPMPDMTTTDMSTTDMSTTDGSQTDSPATDSPRTDATPPDRDASEAGPMCVAMGASCLTQGCCTGLMCCSGVPVPPGADYCGVECPRSDRNLKDRFASVDPAAVLDQVSRLPMSTWTYRDEPNVRHMGPMAQDFRAAFGLGHDDRHIHTVDGNGVALAAIQALALQVNELRQENRRLRQDLDALRHP